MTTYASRPYFAHRKCPPRRRSTATTQAPRRWTNFVWALTTGPRRCGWTRFRKTSARGGRQFLRCPQGPVQIGGMRPRSAVILSHFHYDHVQLPLLPQATFYVHDSDWVLQPAATRPSRFRHSSRCRLVRAHPLNTTSACSRGRLTRSCPARVHPWAPTAVMQMSGRARARQRWWPPTPRTISQLRGAPPSTPSRLSAHVLVVRDIARWVVGGWAARPTPARARTLRRWEGDARLGRWRRRRVHSAPPDDLAD